MAKRPENTSDMAIVRLKDVCVGLTCVDTSGLEEEVSELFPLGRTVVDTGERATGQGSASGVEEAAGGEEEDEGGGGIRVEFGSSDITRLTDFTRHDIKRLMEATTSARLTKGKWSLTAQTVLMDRFYPGAHELESLKDFERERILGHSKCNSVVFLYPALKVSTNGGEAICDVCREPWRGRIWHSKCVRSEHVQRIQRFDEADQTVLGSRVICGQRRSWRLVKPGEVSEGKEFCCGNCGFNMGQSCEEFIRTLCSIVLPSVGNGTLLIR